MFTSSVVSQLTLAFMGVGPTEMVIIGVVAVLLFGSKLPEVARSMGKSVVEFKKGIRGVEDELNTSIYSSGSTSSSSSNYYSEPEVDDQAEATAPKFEPPASEPQVAGSDEKGSAGQTA
jgi:sec-independent protein translocase protein TatA